MTVKSERVLPGKLGLLAPLDFEGFIVTTHITAG